MEYLVPLWVCAVLIALVRSPSRHRRGYGVNDLSQWEAFGGTLKRPPPPPPFQPRG